MMGSSFDAAQESHKHTCSEVARLEGELFEAQQAVLREGLEVERLRKHHNTAHQVCWQSYERPHRVTLQALEKSE